MSRRDTERDRGDREREREKHREVEGRRQPPPSSRSHEYFVPRDGIDREVITADICRYLGNDALVRPGSYENPQTRQVQQGYFITAYRNLTTAMIADLRVDSERWEKERRAAAGGRPINAPQYIGSRTQHDREYNGPSSDPPPNQGGFATPSSTGSSAPGQPSGMPYGDYNSSQYQQTQPQQNYISSGSGAYGQQPLSQQTQFPIHHGDQRPDYTFGASFAVEHSGDPRGDPRSAGRGQVTQTSSQVPRSDMYSSSSGQTPNYPNQDPNRGVYNPYSQPPVSSNQYSQQPTDTFYGRAPAAPVSSYDAMDYSSDSRSQQSYQDPSVYTSQAPMSSMSSATFTQAPMSSMSTGFTQPPMSSGFTQPPMSSGFTQPPMSSGFSQPPVSATVNPTISTGAPTSRRGDREDRRREDRDSRHHRRP